MLLWQRYDNNKMAAIFYIFNSTVIDRTCFFGGLVCKIAKSDAQLRHVCPNGTTGGSHWTDFNKILYLSLFQKPAEKIQVLFESDKSNRYFTLRGVCGSVVVKALRY